jgi:hypothetical protein
MTEVAEQAELTDYEFEQQLPKPVGYRVLVAMPEVEETWGDSGLLKPRKLKFKTQLCR